LNDIEILKKTLERSDQGLARLREKASELFSDNKDFVFGANGSYARREATSGSDLDLFVLFESNGCAAADAYNQLTALLPSLEFRPPSAGGVFEDPLSISNLVTNIGGQEDSNETITRRMLLLLEGEWIFNKTAFDETREKIISAYVPDSLRDDQICLFLLNDIIRYWRTICSDFEFKIKAGDKAKAIRVIKLRFSRMLLYFAGIIAVAETHNMSAQQKRSKLVDLFNMPPITRLQNIVGDRANAALESYCQFLKRIDDPEIRKILDDSSPEAQKAHEFLELRKLSHEFRNSLSTLIQELYPLENHPLQKALML
jgi:predicted nucleotidyltransferase